MASHEDTLTSVQVERRYRINDAIYHTIRMGGPREKTGKDDRWDCQIVVDENLVHENGPSESSKAYDHEERYEKINLSDLYVSSAIFQDQFTNLSGQPIVSMQRYPQNTLNYGRNDTGNTLHHQQSNNSKFDFPFDSPSLIHAERDLDSHVFN